MAIGTPRLATATPNTTAGTTLAVPYPTAGNAPVAGDYMAIVLFINTNDESQSPPAGWTDEISMDTGTNTTPVVRVYSKFAVGGESGSVSCSTASATSQGIMFVVSGVDSTTPNDVAPTFFERPAANTTFPLAAVTLVNSGVTLLAAAAQNSATGTWTEPASPGTWTEALDAATTTPKAFLGYVQGQASGSTGTITITSSTSVRGISVLLALRPAAGATPVSGTETSTGADAMSALSTAETGSDTAAGADSSALGATGAGSDTGSGGDSSALAATLAGTDAASGADAKSVLTAALAGTETSTGTDASSLTTQEAGTDTVSGADAASALVVAVTGSDSAAAVDATSNLDTGATAKAGSDGASAVDSASVTVVLAGSDTGMGADASALTAAPAGTDSGGAVDASSLAAVLAGTQTASAADLSSLAAALAATQLAAAVDAGTVQVAGPPPTAAVGARSTGRLIEPGTGHITTPVAHGRLLGEHAARFLTGALEGELL